MNQLNTNHTLHIHQFNHRKQWSKLRYITGKSLKQQRHSAYYLYEIHHKIGYLPVFTSYFTHQSYKYSYDVFIIILEVKKMTKYISFVAILLLSPTADSHELLTQILVAPEEITHISPDSNRFEVAETFYLTQNDLAGEQNKSKVKQEVKRIAADNSRASSTDSIYCNDWDIVFNTCGQFDDWNKGRLIAIEKCEGVAAANTTLYPNGLIPQFLGPATFIELNTAAANHHDNYSFSDGLWFNCIEIVSSLPAS